MKMFPVLLVRVCCDAGIYVFIEKRQKQFGYSKGSQILNTFLFLFSNKMLVYGVGIHKILVRIANREDPDSTASSEAV